MKKELLNQIAKAIMERFGLTPERFYSQETTRLIKDARQLFFFVAVDRGIQNYQIQEHLVEQGNYTAHSTISHGVKKVRRKFESDDDYVAIVNHIQSKVKF